MKLTVCCLAAVGTVTVFTSGRTRRDEIHLETQINSVNELNIIDQLIDIISWTMFEERDNIQSWLSKMWVNRIIDLCFKQIFYLTVYYLLLNFLIMFLNSICSAEFVPLSWDFNIKSFKITIDISVCKRISFITCVTLIHISVNLFTVPLYTLACTRINMPGNNLWLV